MDTKQNTTHLDIIVPPMGEGIQEVKIIKFLKNKGDNVKKDEILYEMETDKSVVEIESPYSGEFLKWEAEEGDIVPVGTIIGKIKGETSKYEHNTNKTLISEKLSKNISLKNIEKSQNILRYLPPRTRKYCQEKNVNIDLIPIPDKSLMPADIDKYLKDGILQVSNKISQLNHPHAYKEVKLSDQQKILNRRFKYSQNNIIPTSMVARIPLKKLYKSKEVLIVNSKDKNASIFQAFAYCVVQTCCNFPKFRSFLIDSETLQESEHLNLGIAVENKVGDLMTAVIPKSESYNFEELIEKMHLHITTVQEGKDQGTIKPNILLTYMGECDVLWGTPLLVEPAVAILFLSFDKEKDYAYLSITVDHRVINGMEVVRFLQRLIEMIDDLGSL